MSERFRWFLLAVLVVALGAAPAAAVKRRAFVTSVRGAGNLSSWPDAGGQAGLAAGDAICRARATAAALPNADAYRAWLSTTTTDAFCHVQGLSGKKGEACGGAPLPGAGPWYLVNGITNFTASLDRLTGAEKVIYRPVMLDENGDEVSGWEESQVWTGTNDSGAVGGPVPGATCADWTSSSNAVEGEMGLALTTAETWTDFTGFACSDLRRLLCFEPGASEVVDLKWSPGAVVFVTSTTGVGGDLSAWPQANGQAGLDAGDEICRGAATAAHLPAPASFVAWLSTSTTDAADRLTVNGPFRRIDAYTVANNKADLIDGATSNSIHVDEQGRYLDLDGFVWTGTNGAGTLAANCDDWQSALASDQGAAGRSSFTRDASWTVGGVYVCAAPQMRLYCFSNVITLFWDGFEYTGDTSRWSSSVP